MFIKSKVSGTIVNLEHVYSIYMYYHEYESRFAIEVDCEFGNSVVIDEYATEEQCKTALAEIYDKLEKLGKTITL